MKRKVGVLVFYHESHSFTPVKTTIENFEDEVLLIGDYIIERYEGTKTAMGGFIDQLSKYEDIEIVPLVAASALPSGVITYKTYETIYNLIIKEISKQIKLDGILIALHGAMVVDGIEDPEEKVLTKIRELLGPKVPIATTLDMHANIDETILNHTPLHFGYKTYPHIDMYDRGVQAAKAIYSVLNENQQYVAGFKKLPMLLPSLNMRSEDGPMSDMLKLAKELEREEDIYNISIFGGFPYADVSVSSASLLVIGSNQQRVDDISDQLSQIYWRKKEEFIVNLPTVEEAIKEAKRFEGNKPLVLADLSDNPASCGTGDTTTLLRAFLEANMKDSLFGCIYDAESIAQCEKVGEGAFVDLMLGGKMAPQFGEPVKVKAKVIKISNGIYHNKGPFNHGLKVDLKKSVSLQVNNVTIVLTGRAISANDLGIFEHLDIDVTKKRVLGLKVKNHFLASFKSIIERTIYVDAPGVSTNDFTKLPYKNINRPIWPIDDITETQI